MASNGHGLGFEAKLWLAADKQAIAIDLVLEQAELLSDKWA